MDDFFTLPPLLPLEFRELPLTGAFLAPPTFGGLAGILSILVLDLGLWYFWYPTLLYPFDNLSYTDFLDPLDPALFLDPVDLILFLDPFDTLLTFDTLDTLLVLDALDTLDPWE